jgi:hypothetical protein
MMKNLLNVLILGAIGGLLYWMVEMVKDLQ